MLAIIKTGGKQYSVQAGKVVKIEKIEGKKGENISFKDVLAISDNNEKKFGTPYLDGVVVEAKILDQIRDKKIIVFKKRRRQNYRSTKGHRQYLTVLKIQSISVNGKKTSVDKTVKSSELNKKTTSKKTNEKKDLSKNISKKLSNKETKTTKKKTTKKTTKKTVKKDKK